MKDPFTMSTFFRMNHSTVIRQKSVVAKSGNHVWPNQNHLLNPTTLILKFGGFAYSMQSVACTETLYVAQDKNSSANNFVLKDLAINNKIQRHES